MTIDLEKDNLQEIIGGAGDSVFNASGTSWNVFIQGGSGNNISLSGAARATVSNPREGRQSAAHPKISQKLYCTSEANFVYALIIAFGTKFSNKGSRRSDVWFPVGAFLPSVFNIPAIGDYPL
jgi:hypothetical protein